MMVSTWLADCLRTGRPKPSSWHDHGTTTMTDIFITRRRSTSMNRLPTDDSRININNKAMPSQRANRCAMPLSFYEPVRRRAEIILRQSTDTQSEDTIHTYRISTETVPSQENGRAMRKTLHIVSIGTVESAATRRRVVLHIDLVASKR